MKGGVLTDCAPCTAGYHCPENATVDPTPCGKGYFSHEGQQSCTICAAGRYCNVNATSFDSMWYSRICPAGLECPEGMDRMPQAYSDSCRKGHYCPRGDISTCPMPCPNGTFNEHTGMKQVSDCQACTEGYYCIPEGLETPAGPCPGGYYCPTGTSEPYTNPCGVGFYRNGSARGSYQDCAQCISGYYCNEEGLAWPKDCPPGYFCVTGSTYPQPCPLGTYSNSSNLRRSTDCTPCPGGYYCDGVGRTEPTDVCDAGFYCREKAYTSAPPEGATGGVCPAGGYCPPGSAIGSACDPGYYSASPGAKTKYDCVPCQPGYFCAGSSSSNATQLCAAGYYCTGGASIPTQFEVTAGHYSKAGAFKEEPCPFGTYQPATKSSECLSCPQGYYCNVTGTVVPEICPKGNYCPPKSRYPTPCDRGTFLSVEGYYEADHCDPCTPGYSCDSVGLAEAINLCDPGFYCLIGSNTTQPVDGSSGDVCPAGYYCPEGTGNYQVSPCPQGSYNNVTGLTHADNCTLCDPGLVCSVAGLTSPDDVCDVGYYCRGGAYSNRPMDGGITGDPCTVGHYCPLGTGKSIIVSL